MQVKVALPSLFKTYTFKIISMRKKLELKVKKKLCAGNSQPLSKVKITFNTLHKMHLNFEKNCIFSCLSQFNND